MNQYKKLPDAQSSLIALRNRPCKIPERPMNRTFVLEIYPTDNWPYVKNRVSALLATTLENVMKLLDVVVTKQAFPEDGVAKGRVGTIVEELDNNIVLVEFADSNGVAYLITPVQVAALVLAEGTSCHPDSIGDHQDSDQAKH